MIQAPVRSPDRRLQQDRERFLTFAFAGADLLLETTADGCVAFAAGAFRTRLGCEPESLLGRQAAGIVAAEDGAVFAACLALLAARGRITPTALRLADAARTRAVLCGLTRPGPDANPLLCLSFGSPPAPLPAAASVCSATLFGREAEQLLREPAPSSALDLLEVVSARPDMPRAEIAAALLDRAGAGTVTGELAPGRFGLLRASEAAPPDLAALVADLDAALRARGVDARISTAERVALEPAEAAGSAARQAVRALRYALSAFARGGAPALAAAGFNGGLAGFIAAATARTALLRRTLAERRFGLAFQPIVGLQDRAIHHYEALLRPDPGPGGARGPADLVTMAEMVGLAEDLDWAVFETAREAALRDRRRDRLQPLGAFGAKPGVPRPAARGAGSGQEPAPARRNHRDRRDRGRGGGGRDDRGAARARHPGLPR